MGKDTLDRAQKKDVPAGTDPGAAPPDGSTSRDGSTSPDVAAQPGKLSAEVLRNLERAAASSVQIFTERGVGSGYIADDNGHILTDSHVILDAKEIFVVTADKKRYRAGIENIDDLEDTATLKLLGPDKSPGPALKVGDPAELKPGDQVFGVGHPLGERDVIITPGKYMGQISPYEFYDGIDPAFGRKLDYKYGIASAATKKDLLDALSRPNLLLDMNSQHGDSGGPYVNTRGEAVGIIQAGGVGFSIGAPSDSVQRLFGTPGKFEIKHGFQAESWAHSYEQSLASDPFRTISLTAATTVPIGALGYYAARRAPWGVGPLVAAQGSLSLLNDLPSYFQSTNSRDAWKSGVASGADALEIAGGIAMLFPRARTFGIVTSALGLTGRAAADFIPNRYVVESITRKDDSTRGPLNWLTLEQ